MNQNSCIWILHGLLVSQREISLEPFHFSNPYNNLTGSLKLYNCTWKRKIWKYNVPKILEKFWEKISLCFPVNFMKLSKTHFYRTPIKIVTMFGNLLCFRSGLIRHDYNRTWNFFIQQRKQRKAIRHSFIWKRNK